MSAIVNEDLNLGRLPVSDGFREVLARALARHREDRFPDARALRDALSGTPEWNLVASGPPGSAGRGQVPQQQG